MTGCPRRGIGRDLPELKIMTSLPFFERRTWEPRLRRAGLWAMAALLAGGGLCFEALGADWHVVGRDAAGRGWFIDRDSLEEEDDYLHAWVKIDYGSPQPLGASGETYVDEVNHLAIDCPTHRYAVTAAHRRDIHGRVVETHFTRPDRWEFLDAPPESIGLRVVEHACTTWQQAVTAEARRLQAYLEGEAFQLAATSEDQTVSAYVNMETASRYDDVVSALVQYRYQAPALVAGKRVKYLLVLEFFDCAQSLRYFGGSMAVDEQGKTLGKYHAESPDQVLEQPVMPDTLGAGVLQMLCREGRTRRDDGGGGGFPAARDQEGDRTRSSSM